MVYYYYILFIDSTNSGDGIYGMMKPGGMPGMPGVSDCSSMYKYKVLVQIQTFVYWEVYLEQA